MRFNNILFVVENDFNTLDNMFENNKKSRKLKQAYDLKFLLYPCKPALRLHLQV